MKTHTELGITAEEHAALVATIDVLRAEQVIFDMGRTCSVRTGNYEDDEERLDAEMSFEPGDNTSYPQSPCGTACCIGGTMSLLMQNGMKLPARITPEMGDAAKRFVWEQNVSGRPLNALFWDVTDSGILPAEGIAAIEQFLAGNTIDPWLEG